MEQDSSGGLAPDNRAAPRIRGMDEPLVEHAPEQRGWIRGVIIGVAAVLTLGALGYFYFNRDTGTETASAPATEQAPPAASTVVAAPPAAAPPAAEPTPPSASQQMTSPAPSAVTPAQTSATATPAAPDTLSPPPGAETSAAQTDTAAQTRAPAQTEPTAQAQAPALPPPAAGSAPAESAAQPDPLRNQPASLPADDVVFVQKPRVNIRSAPGTHGRIVGSASEGDQFKVVGRSGTWVQVEGDGRKGWISGRLVGPQSP